MINKKILILMISIIVSITTIGCTSSNANSYSNDYNKVSEMSKTSLEISDAYSNSESKGDFKKESKRIIKDLKKTKMKTKEGKEVLNAYIDISEYIVDIILDNWNKGLLQFTGDNKIVQLEDNLKNKINMFDEKIETLKVESGFYDVLEELK